MEPTTSQENNGKRRTRVRAYGAAGAVVAAVIVWAIAGPLLGVELEVTPGAGEPQRVGPGSVIIASAVAALVGWGSLALLERLSPRGRQAWTFVAVIALVGSLAGPLAGVTTAVTGSLAAMHLAVGAVLIPVLTKA